MRTPCIAVVAGLLGAAAPLGAAAAPAGPASAAATSQARAAAERGERLYNEGKYARAIASFEEAEELFHAPTFLLMIARAQDKLGNLIQARATYERILDEELPASAPAPFKEAQAKARRELDALTSRIPTVQILVTGAAPDLVRLTIDREAAKVGRRLPQNPGEHTIIALAPGDITATRKVTLEEGDEKEVTVDLGPERQDNAAGPGAPSVPDSAAPSGGGSYAVPAGIAFALAGVGVGIGTVTGVLSTDKVGELREQCPDKKCYDDADATYGSARTLAVASTISFVAAGALAIGGLVLLVVDPGDAAPAKTSLVVGPGWLSVRGGF